jgi:hypothetical protein
LEERIFTFDPDIQSDLRLIFSDQNPMGKPDGAATMTGVARATADAGLA